MSGTPARMAGRPDTTPPSLGLPYMAAGSQEWEFPEERSPSSSPQIFMQLLNNLEQILLCLIKLTVFVSPTSISSVHPQEFFITSVFKEENRMLWQYPYFLFYKRGKTFPGVNHGWGTFPTDVKEFLQDRPFVFRYENSAWSVLNF